LRTPVAIAYALAKQITSVVHAWAETQFLVKALDAPTK
jgi:hypothetical protein